MKLKIKVDFVAHTLIACMVHRLPVAVLSKETVVNASVDFGFIFDRTFGIKPIV